MGSHLQRKASVFTVVVLALAILTGFTLGSQRAGASSTPSVPIWHTAMQVDATLATQGHWNSIAFGDKTYVAVSDLGFTMHSSDGRTWSTPVQIHGEWNQVIWADQRFVVVGNGYIEYSYNGITWSLPIALSGDWQSVAYGNNEFMALAQDGSTAISTNGISWTSGFTLSDGFLGDYWNSIAYGNHEFVAVSTSGFTAFLLNGASWAAEGSTVDVNRSILLGDNAYVLFAAGQFHLFDGPLVISSPDVHWGQLAGLLDNYDATLHHDGVTSGTAAYGNDEFVVVGNLRTSFSPDGQTWIYANNAASQQWSSVVVADHRIVALGFTSAPNINGDLLTISEEAPWNSPLAPRNVEARSRTSKLVISWGIPSYAGSSPITTYTATASPGGHTCNTTTTSCTITGLTNHTRYVVAVTASNSAGNGPAALSSPTRG